MHRVLSSIFLAVLFYLTEVNAVCTPAGTAGDDISTCTGVINTYQNFFGGSDTVTLSNVTARTGNNIYFLDESLGGNVATDGNDTFTATDSAFVWVLGFGGDDSFNITNSEFNNLYADTNPGHGTSQRGNDTILIENSTSYGYILGGNDNDHIEIKDSNVSNIAAGYSNIYSGIDYTPFDGNDTIIIDHVNFNAPLYWYPSETHGVVTGGRGDDNITFKHGGEMYYVYGGHGNDRIEFFDDAHVNACNSSILIGDACGIYGDVSYASELHASMTPVLHGNDTIILHDGSFSGIFIQGGDGSDLLEIHTPVLLADANISGGDDRSISDGFIDRLVFDGWSGDLNGSLLINWETILLDNASRITFINNTLSTGFENGSDATTGLPYGLVIESGSVWDQFHDFTLDGNLHNRASVNLQDGNAGGTMLTVTGNYSGGVALYLDTVLNDATPSLSDKLVIQGDSTGETTVFIDNIGGTGGSTPPGSNSGILVVEVHGNSNGTFVLGQPLPLEAGEYLYGLYKGTNGNWYLRSRKKTGGISGKVTEKILCPSVSYKPIKDVVIVLFKADGHEVARTRTDANGNYRFDHLIPGKYYIQEAQPKGYADLSPLDNTIHLSVTPDSISDQNNFIEKKVPCGCVHNPILPCPVCVNGHYVHAYATQPDATTAKLHWSDTSDEITYDIYVNGIFVASVGKNITNYTLENLQSDTSYSVAIVARNTTGGVTTQTIMLRTPKVDAGAWLPALYYVILN